MLCVPTLKQLSARTYFGQRRRESRYSSATGPGSVTYADSISAPRLEVSGGTTAITLTGTAKLSEIDGE